ncbi:MAG: heavy metal translocating P-type ATPase [Desulfobacter sp.]
MFNQYHEKSGVSDCGCSTSPDKIGVERSEAEQDRHHGRFTPATTALDGIGCGCGSEACASGGSEGVQKGKQGARDTVLKYARENWQLALSFIVFVYGLISGLEGQARFAVFVFAYALIARDVLAAAIKGVLNGKMLDENFLMGIASIVAFAIGEYAEGVAVMLFYQVGQAAEHYALNRSKKSISALLDIQPVFANIKTPLGVKRVDPSQVTIGDIIVVKAGEKIPLDGTVVSGRSSLDTSAITGESLPAPVERKTKVYSGSINLSAVIEVRAEKDYENSTVSKIIALVEKTNQNKAKTEKFITKFAKVYTPAVVVAAVLIAVFPPLLLAEPFSKWVYRAAIFLVVSCPCALVISVPLGYFGGIGGAARAGILIKGGNFLEALKSVGTVVFDKTGTLTMGNFEINRIEALNGYATADILRISAHLEGFSNHPIAKAISQKYAGTIHQDDVTDITEIPGKGVEGVYRGAHALIGNAAMMAEYGISLPSHTSEGTLLFVAIDRRVCGILSIADQLKKGAAKGIQALKNAGINQIAMLTGDRENIAERIADKLGITRVFSQLLPHEKVGHLETLIKGAGKKKVVFVGDGINDAPVLSRADVGIAMGGLGSDIAIEAADVVLMTDEITKVAEAIHISRFTGRIIWQNIILALGVKALVMILGVVGIANMWIAIFGDVGVAILAILNAGRAIYFSGAGGQGGN